MRSRVFGQSKRYFMMILAAALLLSLHPGSVKSAQDEYSVKAAFIGKVISFIRWPNELRETDFFLLCLIGENPFNQRLEKVAEFSVGKKPVLHIKYIQKPEHIVGCDLLFIAKSETGQLNAIIEYTERWGVLTVGDMRSFAHRGGIIAFVMKENKVRLEINRQAAEKAGLTISSKLLEIAKIVK